MEAAADHFVNTMDQSFRDSVSTIGKGGGRAWIYPKKPTGPYFRKRTIVSIVLLTFLFGLPFVFVNGHPLMLFNILERKFIILGIPFWPQDFFLFVIAMLTFFVFIILFTSIFGRLWCGWACPQTIFMEMVFRRIEYLIEGDSKQQIALNKAPWHFEKIRKKATKHFIFFLLSFIIANTFLAYIIGIDKLKLLATDGPGNHMGGFFALIGFTGAFYGVYARFREQACLVVCPYGRLQGVLLDRNSVVIAYDYSRGEPRSRINRNEKRLHGDCIDCSLCVQVCPTGIDIRNGTQLECVNCTACMDACDEVMEKVGFPKKLIRFASENNIANKTRFKFTSRIIGYSVVLVFMMTTLTLLLAFRSDIETTVLRVPGQLYQRTKDNRISNLYNIQIVNKTFRNLPLEIRIKNKKGEISFAGVPVDSLHNDALVESVFFVTLPRSELQGIKTPIIISIYSGNQLLDEVKTNFLGPN